MIIIKTNNRIIKCDNIYYELRTMPDEPFVIKNNNVVLGVYNDKKIVDKIFSEIFDAIYKGHKLYVMPE